MSAALLQGGRGKIADVAGQMQVQVFTKDFLDEIGATATEEAFMFPRRRRATLKTLTAAATRSHAPSISAAAPSPDMPRRVDLPLPSQARQRGGRPPRRISTPTLALTWMRSFRAGSETIDIKPLSSCLEHAWGAPLPT